MSCVEKFKDILKKIQSSFLIDGDYSQIMSYLEKQYSTYNLKSILKIIKDIDEQTPPGDAEIKKHLLNFIMHSLNNRESNVAIQTENAWLEESKKNNPFYARDIQKTRLRASKTFYTFRIKKIYDFFSSNVIFESIKKSNFDISFSPQKAKYEQNNTTYFISGIGVRGKFWADSNIYKNLTQKLKDDGFVLVKNPQKDEKINKILELNISNDDYNIWFDPSKCVYVNTNNKEPKVIVLQRMTSFAKDNGGFLNFRIFFEDKKPKYIPPSSFRNSTEKKVPSSSKIIPEAA